jgi:hypothetical protein
MNVLENEELRPIFRPGKEEWILLMHSKLTPTCFGKW